MRTLRTCGNDWTKSDTVNKVDMSIKCMDSYFNDAMSESGVNDKFLSLLFRLIDEGASDERIIAVVKAKKNAVYKWVREAHELNAD